MPELVNKKERMKTYENHISIIINPYFAIGSDLFFDCREDGCLRWHCRKLGCWCRCWCWICWCWSETACQRGQRSAGIVFLNGFPQPLASTHFPKEWPMIPLTAGRTRTRTRYIIHHLLPIITHFLSPRNATEVSYNSLDGFFGATVLFECFFDMFLRFTKAVR